MVAVCLFDGLARLWTGFRIAVGGAGKVGGVPAALVTGEFVAMKQVIALHHFFKCVGQPTVLQEGLLEGLSLAWQSNWWGEATMGSRTGWITPGGGTHNAIIGYGAGNWRLNLRISNVFDSVEIYPSTFETAVIVNPLRDYRVSFTYDF